jgi:hypothetical protein
MTRPITDVVDRARADGAAAMRTTDDSSRRWRKSVRCHASSIFPDRPSAHVSLRQPLRRGSLSGVVRGNGSTDGRSCTSLTRCRTAANRSSARRGRLRRPRRAVGDESAAVSPTAKPPASGPAAGRELCAAARAARSRVADDHARGLTVLDSPRTACRWSRCRSPTSNRRASSCGADDRS